MKTKPRTLGEILWQYTYDLDFAHKYAENDLEYERAIRRYQRRAIREIKKIMEVRK